MRPVDLNLGIMDVLFFNMFFVSCFYNTSISPDEGAYEIDNGTCTSM